MDFLANLNSSWNALLQEELQKTYVQDIMKKIQEDQIENITIYPPENLIFNAFHHTPFEKVKVVIL